MAQKTHLLCLLPQLNTPTYRPYSKGSPPPLELGTVVGKQSHRDHLSQSTENSTAVREHTGDLGVPWWEI